MTNFEKSFQLREDVLAAHRQLSQTSVDFLEYVQRTPKSMIRREYDLTKLQASGENFQPWPTFVNQHTRQQLKHVATGILDLIRSLPQRFFNLNPKLIAQYFNFLERDVRLLIPFTEPLHLDMMLSRGDYAMTATGIKCFECNIVGSLGGWEVSYLQHHYAHVPVIAQFLQEKNIQVCNYNLLDVLFKHLIQSIRRKFGTSVTTCNSMIMMPLTSEWHIRDRQEGMLTGIYQQALKETNNQGNLYFGRVSDVTLKNDVLYFKNNRINLILEMVFGAIPPEVYQSFLAGNMCLINGPICRLLSDKFNIALLSENQDSDLFTADERQIIKSTIPWTRRVGDYTTEYNSEPVKLVDFMLANKDKLVIKPKDGISGVGVVVGRYATPEVWQAAVKHALSEFRWVVQEYIESLSYMYQNGADQAALYRINWGLFVFGKEYAGEFLRYLPLSNDRGVMNRSKGAEEGVVFGVNE